MNNVEVLIFPEGLTVGAKVRLARIGRRWRQVDLAEEACVSQAHVSALERDLPIYPEAKRRILASLGLLDEGAVDA